MIIQAQTYRNTCISNTNFTLIQFQPLSHIIQQKDKDGVTLPHQQASFLHLHLLVSYRSQIFQGDQIMLHQN